MSDRRKGKGPLTDNSPLDELLRDELEAIEERRRQVLDDKGHQTWKNAGTPIETVNANQVFGLAFSGGGIRSATFALGVIQALAELRQLRRVDYLSTVSGGGYIGAWLLGLFRRLDGVTKNEDCNREVAKKFEESLRPPVSPLGELDIQSQARPEHPAIRWLRQYSNYLAPRPSLFSADVWNIAAIWLRNALLNQIVLAALLGSILLSVRTAADFFIRAGASEAYFRAATIAFWISLAAICARLLVSHKVLTGKFVDKVKEWSGNFSSSGQGPAVGMALGLYVAAFLSSISIWNVLQQPDVPLRVQAGTVVAIGTLVAALSSVDWRMVNRHWALILLRVLIATAVATVVFLGVSIGIGHVFLNHWVCAVDGQYKAMIWGPCIILLSFGLQVILMLGLMGTYLDDFSREWWSRLGAWLTILASVPTAIAWIGLYGPPFMIWLWNETIALKASLSMSWVLITLTGVFGAFSSKTNGKAGKTNKLLEWIVPIAPPVFVLGLLLLVSVGVDEGMHWLTLNWPWHSAESSKAIRDYFEMFPGVRDINFYAGSGIDDLKGLPYAFGESRIVTAYFRRLTPQPWWLHMFGTLALSAIAALIAWALDINQFSMHQFYRNRLVRAYLGASRRKPPRDADRFTNFDPDDDIPLHELKSHPDKHFLGPVSIVNGALNLASPDAGKQERRASSFTFGPFYCGYDAVDEKERLQYFYQRSDPREYKPHEAVTLGHAITVSGAAASPNMGYHSSMPLAFLMTVFNVRLGWWFPNPGRPKAKWGNNGPTFGLAALISELFAMADLHSRHIYVSDGGHFENMGVYELLRRRCRYIICVDAESDGMFSFGGLGSLIRKARADFGVEIELDTSAISELNAKGYSARHCAAGTIWYPEPGLRGTLLYIKSSVTGDEPGDILQYQLAKPQFPHETTGDQFFSESQLESYRRLGYHALIATFQPAQSRDGTLPALHETFLRLRQAWGSTPRFSATQFTALTRRLDKLIESLRTDPDLAFLHTQFYYPQWGQVRGKRSQPWPLEDRIFQSGFFFCISLLQMMEDVYLELDLETHHDHPDCSGWMNQFRQWAASDMLRLTNAIAGATFGERFQSFVERHLDLQPCGVVVNKDEYQFNEVEIGIQQDLARSLLLPLERKFFRPIQVEIDPVLPNEMPGIEKIRLTVGFYVVDQDGKLRWMRIQNHLRRMGIARRALTVLCDERRTPGDLPPEPRKEDGTKNVASWWETDSARHIRWVKSVLGVNEDGANQTS